MSDLNVVALFKGEYRYIFVYDEESREEVVAAIRDTAADAVTPFNWFDAAVLTERTRQHAAVGAGDGL